MPAALGALILALLFPLLLLLSPFAAAAQIAAPPEAEETAAAPADPLERETPRSAVSALVRALAEQNYPLAGNYFALPEGEEERGDELARALQRSLDAGGELVPFAELSTEPTGSVDEALSPDLERVGTLGGPEAAPIILVRAEREEGQAIWRISPETIAELEEHAETLTGAPPPPEEALLVAGAPVQDWLFMLGLLAGGFIILRLAAAIVLKALRSVIAEPKRSGIYRFSHAALPPLSLMLAVGLFQLWGGDAPVSIIVRQTLLRYSGIIAWIALAWFAMRLIDALAKTITSRMQRAQRRQAASVVALARRAAKLLLLAIAFIAILDTLGVDVTTGVAALGIGGLALALGAQKSIENLVGSVMVIADRPIEVGDFCRVGDVTGTVEDIGMRSTRIRTNDRTIVTIPNADFSSLQIENYSKRDRFLFHVIIRLEYGISAEQLREALGIVNSAIEEHDLVAEEDRRVKLRDLGISSIEIEIFAYIAAPDYVGSLEVRQQLLLAIYERLQAAGHAIALPMQSLYLHADQNAAGEAGPR